MHAHAPGTIAIAIVAGLGQGSDLTRRTLPLLIHAFPPSLYRADLPLKALLMQNTFLHALPSECKV